MRNTIKHCSTCKYQEIGGTMDYHDVCTYQQEVIYNSDNGVNCKYFSPHIFERISAIFGRSYKKLPESGGVIK